MPGEEFVNKWKNSWTMHISNGEQRTMLIPYIFNLFVLFFVNRGRCSQREGGLLLL